MLFQVIPEDKRNPEYFTISATGVVHICPGQPCEYMSAVRARGRSRLVSQEAQQLYHFDCALLAVPVNSRVLQICFCCTDYGQSVRCGGKNGTGCFRDFRFFGQQPALFASAGPPVPSRRACRRPWSATPRCSSRTTGGRTCRRTATRRPRLERPRVQLLITSYSSWQLLYQQL